MRLYRKKPALSLVTLATLVGLASHSIAFDARAQTFASVPTLTARGRDIAVAVDSVGLRSTPISSDARALLLQVPPGATVVSASLFTFVRFRADLTSIPPLLGSVRLNGQPVLNGGAPPAMVFPGGSSARCVGTPTQAVCFFTIRSDVTAIVENARAASVAASLSLPVEETGDSVSIPTVLGEAFSFQGHALVALYRNARTMVRERFVGVWAGAADESVVDLSPTLRALPLAVCPAGSVPERDERVAVSTTVLSEESVCGESNEIQFTFPARSPVTFMGIGGADDGGHTPIDALACTLIGRASDVRALVTTGSFGGALGMGTSASASLTGRPVGVDGDELGNGPVGFRRNDELFTLDAVPSTIRLSQGTDPELSPLKSLGLVVMQFPLDSDSDGDGHSDVSEGICRRIDTDSDGAQREDWDDPDSDNDCVLDSVEVGAARTTVAAVSVSDDACRARTPMAPFCNQMSGQCAPCMISCATNPMGKVCRRLPSTVFGCGCFGVDDCPMGARCSSATGVCERDPNMDGGASTDGGAEDASAGDVGAGDVGAGDVGAADVGAGDVGAPDAAGEGDVATDGGASGDASNTVIRPLVPSFRGGACQCRAGGATAPRSAFAPVAICAALSVVVARRRRRKARASTTSL